MVRDPADDVAALVTSAYAGLNFRPPPGQFTVLAGFVLRDAHALKLVSLGTGSKCLPAARLAPGGDVLHDSHAEVLARRGAVRWFLEEVARMQAGAHASSRWLRQALDGSGKYELKPEATLILYVSTVPCTCTPCAPLLNATF